MHRNTTSNKSSPKSFGKSTSLSHNYATKSSLVTMGRPNSPQSSPFPFDDHHLRLINLSLDRPQSPSQTASGSNQPFCHSTVSGPTDQLTDRHTIRVLAIMRYLATIAVGVVSSPGFVWRFRWRIQLVPLIPQLLQGLLQQHTTCQHRHETDV